jgi:hypothetical protein
MQRIERYGKLWREGLTVPQIELACWANYDVLFPTPEIERWRHLKNAIILIDKEMRDGWNDWTELMCWAYGTYDYIAALGCTASTKTHTFHNLAFYDYMSSPLKTMVTCTTTNSQGLDSRMWPIISSTFAYVKKTGMINDWKKTVAPYKLVRPTDSETKHVIKAQTIDPKADRQAVVDQLIGAHAKRRVWLVDEATSAPMAIQDAWPNAAAATDHRRLVMMGNPNDEADSLSNFCRPRGGWSSVDEETETWEFDAFGGKGIGLHFHGKNSPNIKHGLSAKGKARWPFMFAQEDMDRLMAIKETNPTQYYRMCVGWFMPEGVSKRVCSMRSIDRFKCREHALFRGGDIRYFAALDPAFGGDRCVLMIFKMGFDVNKKKVVMDMVKKFHIPVDPRGLPGEQIGRFVLEKSREFKLDRIGIDTTTGNSSCAEWLELNSTLKVDWIPFGGAASAERTVSPQDDRLCKDAYYNKAAELAFGVANGLEVIHGLDEDTCIQLTSRYWEPIGDKPTRQKIETKALFKDRMKRSPDEADCLAVGVEVFRLMGGQELKKSSNRSLAWNQIAKKKNSIWSSEHSYA